MLHNHNHCSREIWLVAGTGAKGDPSLRLSRARSYRSPQKQAIRKPKSQQKPQPLNVL